jgi:hypothetical protein
MFLGRKNPCINVEIQHDSPKANVFCDKTRLCGPFFTENVISSLVPRYAGAVALSATEGGLPWLSTLPGKHDTTPFSFGYENIPG